MTPPTIAPVDDPVDDVEEGLAEASGVLRSATLESSVGLQTTEGTGTASPVPEVVVVVREVVRDGEIDGVPVKLVEVTTPDPVLVGVVVEVLISLGSGIVSIKASICRS